MINFKKVCNKKLNKRSWYGSWKEFSILFPFFVTDKELKEVNLNVKLFYKKIINDLKLKMLRLIL